jgi:hypothetical protein
MPQKPSTRPRCDRFLDRQVAPRMDPDGCQPRKKSWPNQRTGCTSTGAATGGCTSAAISTRKPPPCSPLRSRRAPHLHHRPRKALPHPRSADHRRGAGLTEWVNLGRDGTDEVIDGGERPQVTVTIGLEELLSELGPGYPWARTCYPSPSRRPAAWPATAKSSRPCWTPSPDRWISAALPGISHHTFAVPWSSETRDVRFLAATAHPDTARRTTSSNGATAATPP